MLGPKYIERNLNAEKYRERCQQMHEQRLKGIAEKKAMRKSQDDLGVESRLMQEKKRTQEFMEMEKKLNINKDNQKLLSKLFEISHGKWSSVTFQDKEINRPRSLNIGLRKKESERIEKENKAFARRLFEKNASLSIKKLENDFNSHEKYKNQIKRYTKKTAKHQGRVNHLPPITATESKSSKRASQNFNPLKEENDGQEYENEAIHKRASVDGSGLVREDSMNKEVSISHLSKQMEIKPQEQKESVFYNTEIDVKDEEEEKKNADRKNGKFVIKKMSTEQVKQSLEAKKETLKEEKEHKAKEEKEHKTKEVEKPEQRQEDARENATIESDTRDKEDKNSANRSNGSPLQKRKSETSSPYGKLNKEEGLHKAQTMAHSKRKDESSKSNSPDQFSKKKSLDLTRGVLRGSEKSLEGDSSKEHSTPITKESALGKGEVVNPENAHGHKVAKEKEEGENNSNIKLVL